MAWLTAWSVRRPLPLIEEVHTPNHPFVQRFEKPNGIDMRKLIGDGIRWGDSSTELGIQVADIAAAIVFDAVHDLKNRNDSWPDFFSLMQR